MSQRDVNVFFVVDAALKSEEQCSDDVWHVFNKCDELDMKPIWILAKNCFDLKPEKTDVFIIENFEGDVFEFLQQFKCSIVSPAFLVKYSTTGKPLPGTSSSVLNKAMDEIVVCVSGFPASVEEDIRKKVEYMGGVYTKSLKGCVTHLVTNTVMSAKYEAAIQSKLCVVQDKWVYAIWDANLDEFVTAADPRFEKFKCPIFLNLFATTSNVPVPVKRKIRQIIRSNGGEFSGTPECTKLQMVLTVRDGDNISNKLKYAQQNHIACLAYEWVLDSVKAGRALPLDEYKIKPIRMCSSPNPTNASFAPHNTATTSGTSIAPPGVETNAAIGDVDHLVVVDSMRVNTVRTAGPFLDGCSIYLIGFSSIHLKKLNRILSYSGATRLDDPTESLTHVIVGDVTKSATEIQMIHTKDINPFIVNVEWLKESIRLKKSAFEGDFLIVPRQKEVPKKRIEPASPLSKKNLAMLSRTKPSSSNQTYDNSSELTTQKPTHTTDQRSLHFRDPTRSLKKDRKRWVDGSPDYHEPPAKKRRQSTLQYSSPGDRSPSEIGLVLQSEATTKRNLSFTGLAEVDPLEEKKKVLKNASDLRESLSGESNRRVKVEKVDEADKYIDDTRCNDFGWDNEECKPSVTPKVVNMKTVHKEKRS